MSFLSSSSDPPVDNRLTADIRTWLRSGEWSSYQRFRSEFRRFLTKTIRRRRYRNTKLSLQTGTSARDADFALGTSIGIKIIHTLTNGSKQWIRRELAMLAQKYDTILVIGFNIPEKHFDTWRNLETKRASRGESVILMTTMEGGTIPVKAVVGSVTALVCAAMYLYWTGLGVVSYWFFNTLRTISVEAGMYAGGVLVFLLVFALFTIYCTFG